MSKKKHRYVYADSRMNRTQGYISTREKIVYQTSSSKVGIEFLGVEK